MPAQGWAIVLPMRTIPTGFLLLPPPSDGRFYRLRRKVRILALRRLLSAPLSGLRPRLVELAKRRCPALLEALGSPDVLCALLVWERGLRPPAALQASLVPDLLAAHAFVPVSALHARLAAAAHPIAQTAFFAERRSAVWESNRRAMDTLGELAEPTAAGARLLRDLNTLHEAAMFHVEHQP